MSSEDGRVVFRTSQPDEAPAIAAKLADADIPFEIRIAVQEERETEALAIIESYMMSIGAAPSEERAAPEPPGDLVVCPNCEKPGLNPRRPCAECGFAVQALTGELAPVDGAKTFCPECRDPLTLASGACPRCKEELEPLEPGDRMCPEGTHVVLRDTKGGAACLACKTVWVDLS